MYLGVDIGGTSIKFAVVNNNLEIVHRDSCPTPDNINILLLDEIHRYASSIKKDYPIDYIGVSAAGVIDVEKAEVISATDNIKNYLGTNFRNALADLDVEVYADNDVNCALLGEQLIGCAKGLEEVFCIALGTGIGGAYYLDKMPKGSCSSVGEIGRSMYDPSTGLNYEKKASTIALEKRIHAEISHNLSVKDFFELNKYIDSYISNIDDRLLPLVENNKEKIQMLMNTWLSDLSLGMANMLLILDPKYVIIGGAISKQGDYLIEKIKKSLSIYNPIKISKTEYLCASLGNDAAIYGAIANFVKANQEV